MVKVVENYLKVMRENEAAWASALQITDPKHPEKQAARELSEKVQRLWNEEICTSPEAAFELLRHFLNTGQLGWQHSRLVDFVAEDHLAELFQTCLPALLLSDDEAKKSGLELHHFCLERLQWQMPELFYPHIEEMWLARSPFWEGWWDSGTRGLQALLKAPDQLKTETESHWNWNIQRALERSNCLESFEWLRLNKGLTFLGDFAGVEYDGTGWRRLYSPTAYHFVFPPEYLQHPNWPDHLKPIHPTWHLPAECGAARLYDKFVPDKLEFEQVIFYRLELLEPPPEIRLTAPLSLQMPEHTAPDVTVVDRQGNILQPDWDDEEIHQFYVELAANPRLHNPFFGAKYIPIRFARTPKRWYRQPDDTEQNLSKVGGMGIWRQVEGEFGEAQCSSCGMLSPLLLQLGDDALRTPFCISSFFWCETCRRVTTVSTYS